jgi:hypothetical protein
VLRLGAFAGLLGAFGCDRLFALEHIDCAECDGGGDQTGDGGAGSDGTGGHTNPDVDGDGILDGADNCVTTANNDQKDHDSDTKGDVCDPCPHLAGASDDVDGDGDGLGNGCDPRPMTSGDTRTLFVGFYQADEISTWVQSPPGAWTITGGVLRLAADNISQATIELPGSRNDLFVQVGVQATSIGPGSIHTFGISAGRTMMTNHTCQLYDSTNDQLIFVEATGNQSASWGGQLTQPNPMKLLVDGTHVVCAVGGLSAALIDVDPASTSTANHMGVLGLVASVVAVDIHYLFIATPG